VDAAVAEDLAGQVRIGRERMGVMEAFLGDRSRVRVHLAVAGAASGVVHALNAYVALQAKDLVSVERQLELAPPNLLLAKAIRADLLIRKGQKKKGADLRQEVLASSIKLDGAPQVDYLKLIARLHAAGL